MSDCTTGGSSRAVYAGHLRGRGGIPRAILLRVEIENVDLIDTKYSGMGLELAS